MPGLVRLLGAALLGVLLAAPTASAVVLTPTPNPLEGSNFQGADGNQDNDAPRLDWEAFQDRVQHSPDANDQDTAFEGGSKENKPEEWDFTTEKDGVIPGKANIRDAWSAVSQPNSRTFLYLGSTRQNSRGEGTTFLTFELNRDSRLWNNGRANIPCRNTGDVLVSYEPHGNDVEVVIQRWITTTPDPKSGCAATGKLESLGSFDPKADAQAAINADEEIANWLGGAYERRVPADRFGEAALALDRLLAGAPYDGCFAFTSMWMHSRSSTAVESNMQDYVAPQEIDARNCAASGTKFFDLDADGVRDPDDPGIPRFLIWADYDNDGNHDAGEPFSVSDDEGRYVIDDIRPPGGTYTLRESLAFRRSRTDAVGLNWTCSFPNNDTDGGTGLAPGGRFRCGWDPINVGQTPYARGKDFGNWFPASLTVEKELEPVSDPGRFDLHVNGDLWLAGAGDGEGETRLVPPGAYDVSERAVAPTDPAAYDSTVECRRFNFLRGGRRFGVVYAPLQLTAGMRAVCTFRNIRPGSSAIAIRKVGPQTATAGDVLRYRFYVENVGDVPFPARGVTVTDPACDEPPELVAKEDASGADDSPGTLDPGDIWTYTCSNQTSSRGEACEATSVDNTGTVTGTTAAGTTVNDDDLISTILFCPDRPAPPLPVPIDPPERGGPVEPGAVAPPGPTPPEAGAAGRAALLFRRAIRGCITRIPYVNFEGTRVRRVRAYVNGRLARRVTVRLLQRRVRPLTRLAPGRYRLTVRVDFQRGAGTEPVTFRGALRVCGAAVPPPVTG